MGGKKRNWHGLLKGQKGFKLSLFGYDPDADYKAVVEASNGRRINRDDPANSLGLLKPTFSVPHGGGHILKKDPPSYESLTLLKWMRGGTPRRAPSPGRLVVRAAYQDALRVFG